MHDTEQPLFSRLMLDIGEMYSKSLSPLMVEMYWQALREFELEVVRWAFKAHACDSDGGRFLPRPADILRWIQGCPEGRALKAWSYVEAAIGRVGRYQSVAFDDPLIHRVIEDLGGWIRLCEQDLKEFPFTALAFQKRYRVLINQTGVRHPPYLVGRVEHDNAKDGYEYPLPLLIGDPDKAKQVMVSGDKKRLSVQPSTQSVQELIQAITHVQQERENSDEKQ